MLRVFGHYVPAPVVALAAGEAGLVFGSVFIGLALPLVGVQAIRPASCETVSQSTTPVAMPSAEALSNR